MSQVSSSPYAAGDAFDSPETKRAYNERLFTEVARRYDTATRALSFFRDAAWKRRLVAGLPDLGEPVVIDVACGSGDLLVRLRARYPRARLTGVDLTAPMLEIARRRLAGADVALVQADMARLPAADGSVDILTGGYALRNAPDLDAFLAEVRRVLKPGGVAAFLDFARPDSPARARVHQALLAFWGGVWGRLLHGDANVYGYIAASLARHPPTAELAHRFAAHGLAVQARAFPLFGIMDLIHAVRPR